MSSVSLPPGDLLADGPKSLEECLVRLRQEEQQKQNLAAEMLAAAQLQIAAQSRVSDLEERLANESHRWNNERDDIERNHSADLAKKTLEIELQLEEALDLAAESDLENRKLKSQIEGGGDPREVSELKAEVETLAKKKDYLKKQLDVQQEKHTEAEAAASVVEAEKRQLQKQNAELFEAKKVLAEKLSKVLLGEDIPEMEGTVEGEKRASLEAQVKDLQDQLAGQACLIKEIEARHKSDMKQATIEMSQFGKKQTDAKAKEIEELKVELERTTEELEKKLQDEKDRKYGEQETEIKDLKKAKQKLEEKCRTLQGEHRVTKLEYDGQIDKLQSRLRRLKERLGDKDADDARREAQAMRTEVLRLRTVVSNVLKEKEVLEASIEEHKRKDTSKQIEALRSETRRLQQYAKKAEDDIAGAHKMKEELHVTLRETERELEENFWKVAEKKLAATWSSSSSAKNYFPRRKTRDPDAISDSPRSSGTPRSKGLSGSPPPSPAGFR